MVKILVNGKTDKKYFCKCIRCATEFEYEYSDIGCEKGENYIFCPECQELNSATLLTKEEYDKLPVFPYVNYGGCV